MIKARESREKVMANGTEEYGQGKGTSAGFGKSLWKHLKSFWIFLSNQKLAQALTQLVLVSLTALLPCPNKGQNKILVTFMGVHFKISDDHPCIPPPQGGAVIIVSLHKPYMYNHKLIYNNYNYNYSNYYILFSLPRHFYVCSWKKKTQSYNLPGDLPYPRSVARQGINLMVCEFNWFQKYVWEES